jgi:predicted TIM-barrel fold metal-dependent hydrolase
MAMSNSDSRFSGLADMQPEVFNRRSLDEVAKLDPAYAASMPKMISTDSHVMEPEELWLEVPERLRGNLPSVKFGVQTPGAGDPALRLKDQAIDGVEAEVLFPNYGMAIFGVDDVETQEVAFRVYNDWIASFCKTSPRNFYGIPCVSVYDIDKAVKEMQRGHLNGLKGVMVWQVPDPRLPFTSEHYEKLWAAAAEARAPVTCHILTGHSYARAFGTAQKPRGMERIRDAVNRKQNDTANALFDFIFSGAFERHPNLKLLLSESEVGWAPFLLQQWDYYFERFRKTDPLAIKRRPSEIFAEHVYATFLEDFVGTRSFSWWGERNCMWSNDYPHFNMSFPNSRENVERHLSGLSQERRLRLVRQNAIELFNLDL